MRAQRSTRSRSKPVKPETRRLVTTTSPSCGATTPEATTPEATTPEATTPEATAPGGAGHVTARTTRCTWTMRTEAVLGHASSTSGRRTGQQGECLSDGEPGSAVPAVTRRSGSSESAIASKVTGADRRRDGGRRRTAAIKRRTLEQRAMVTARRATRRRATRHQGNAASGQRGIRQRGIGQRGIGQRGIGQSGIGSPLDNAVGRGVGRCGRGPTFAGGRGCGGGAGPGRSMVVG